MRLCCPVLRAGRIDLDTTSKKCRRHTLDQIFRKLAEGNKLLASGRELDGVCRRLEVAESTRHRWVAHYGGMKSRGLLQEQVTRLVTRPDRPVWS